MGVVGGRGPLMNDVFTELRQVKNCSCQVFCISEECEILFSAMAKWAWAPELNDTNMISRQDEYCTFEALYIRVTEVGTRRSFISLSDS
jgi:hypothetical protein